MAHSPIESQWDDRPSCGDCGHISLRLQSWLVLASQVGIKINLHSHTRGSSLLLLSGLEGHRMGDFVSFMGLYVLSVDSLMSQSLIVRTSDALFFNGNRIMSCHQESASEKWLLNGPLCGTRSESTAGCSKSSNDGTVDKIPHIGHNNWFHV